MKNSCIICFQLTFELSDVVAARRRLSLSFRSTGVEISVRYSTALDEAFINDSATIVGWMPFSSIFSAAPSRLPAKTTTEVVPSPASISCAADKSTNCKGYKRRRVQGRKITNHLCCRMQRLYALQNCGSIVCYDDLSFRRLDLQTINYVYG